MTTYKIRCDKGENEDVFVFPSAEFQQANAVFLIMCTKVQYDDVTLFLCGDVGNIAVLADREEVREAQRLQRMQMMQGGMPGIQL